MPISEIDSRIKFNPDKTISLQGQVGSLSVEVFGGPLARVQAAIFADDNSLLTGVGFGDFGLPLTTEVGGRASWLFQAPKNASFMKWSVQAVRSAAGLGNYSVTAKVRDANGDALQVSQFNAAIPDGAFSDNVIFDGVNFKGPGNDIPGGPKV
jgi:hypothetical protein